ncbi:MAG: hypothetical protein LBI04_08570 [Treponema sp.]|jgi:hypothetical protein|nr:hypothetical protein [Treponema sp.]
MSDLYSKMYLIFIAIVLAFALAQAFLGYWLASEKGRSPKAWFWLCLFFGIPALITLGLSPQAVSLNVKKIVQKKEESLSHDMSVSWNCPKCNKENPNDSYTCKSCGYKLQ